MTYRLNHSYGDGSKGHFAIDKDTGEITKAKSGDFQYKSDENFYSLQVIASDGGNLNATCLVHVNVTDANSAPTLDRNNVTLRESVNGSHTILSISAMDDGRKELEFSITGCQLSSGITCTAFERSMFDIRFASWEDTGVVEEYQTTAHIVLNVSDSCPSPYNIWVYSRRPCLDFEDSGFDEDRNPYFRLAIQVKDGADVPLTDSAYVLLLAHPQPFCPPPSLDRQLAVCAQVHVYSHQ